jgi:hypothetical protein
MVNGALIFHHRVKLISEFGCHKILDVRWKLSLSYHLLTVCPLQHLPHFLEGVLRTLSSGGKKMKELVHAIAAGTVVRIVKETAQQA